MTVDTMWRFGGGPDDYARHPTELELLPGIPLRVLDVDSGDEITDLIDASGTPVVQVYSGDDGTFDFRAPATAVDIAVPTEDDGERLWRVLSKDALRSAVGSVTGSAGGLRTTVPGLVTGTVVDNGPKIQAVLNRVGADGYDHSSQVDVEGPFAQPVYINSAINIEAGMHVRFLSDIVAGPLFRVRIQGEVAELPASGKPILTADYTAEALTIDVNDVTPFAAGDYIVVRGARGATGDPVDGQKLYAYVDSVTGDGTGGTITLTEGLDADFAMLNPNPDAPPGTSPESQVTKVVAGNLTVNAARGGRVVTVHDTSPFTPGDTVQVMDDARTTRSTTGLPEKDNFIHREMNTVAEVISGTQLRLEHALHHPCDVTQLGKVILVNPARGAMVTGARVRWQAMSTVQTAFEMRYAVSSRFIDCEVTGTGVTTTGRATKSWLGQAFRIADSLYCATIRCRASRPAQSGGGEGYGFTLYGSTMCGVLDCWGSGLRHTVLLFNSACGNLIRGVHGENTLLSDFDLHGCGSTDNLFTACVSSGGGGTTTNGDANRAAVRVGNTAHQDGDYFNVFDGILVYGFHDGAAIDLVASSHHNEVRNVTAIQCLTGIRARPTPSSVSPLYITSNVVSGFTARDVTNLLDVNGGTDVVVKKLLIEGAKAVGMATHIRPQNAEEVEFRRLDLIDPALSSSTFAVYATNVAKLVVRHCDLSRGGKGVKLDTCPDSRITMTSFHDMGSTVVIDDTAGGNAGSVFKRNDYAGFTPTASGSGTSFTPDLT